jgi:hypothetical protein
MRLGIGFWFEHDVAADLASRAHPVRAGEASKDDCTSKSLALRYGARDLPDELEEHVACDLTPECCAERHGPSMRDFRPATDSSSVFSSANAGLPNNERRR